MAKLQYFGRAGTFPLSHSILEKFDECPRKFQLTMLLHSEVGGTFVKTPDLAYGHCFAAGIQSYLNDWDMDKALWEMFTMWDIPMLEEKVKSGRVQKSIWRAVDYFHQFISLMDDWDSREHWQGWKVLQLPDGKSGVELTFKLNIGDVYNYQGHIDLIMQHEETKKLRVVEIKTTSSTAVHPAMYGNSPQTVGYQLVCEQIAQQLGVEAEMEVLYLVHSVAATSPRPFFYLPFDRGHVNKSRWFQTLALKVSQLEEMRALNFFPQNWKSCHNYMRPCAFYGMCELPDSALAGKNIAFDWRTTQPDYEFNLIDLMQQTLYATE